MEIFLKEQHFPQRSKFSLEIDFLFKNRNFPQRSKFSSKIVIFLKDRNFPKKSKFSSKIEIFLKNRNFPQRSKYSSKMEIFLKNLSLINLVHLVKFSLFYNTLLFFDKIILQFLLDKFLDIFIQIFNSFVQKSSIFDTKKFHKDGQKRFFVKLSKGVS